MCGRYTLARPGDVIDPVATPELSGILLEPGTRLVPRYNIAPTQPAAIVRAPFGGPRLGLVRWGLVPQGARAAAAPLINARLETARTRASFRDSLEKRRCLVPAHGFFEWRRAGKGARAQPQPFYFTAHDGALLAFAGLWDRVPAGVFSAEAVESMCILTTVPNPLVAELHDRMPVILPRELWRPWLLADGASLDDLLAELAPHPAEGMHRRPVGTRVNSVANDDPSCLEEAVETPRNLTLF